MSLKQWINPVLVGLLILFSLPLKLPALQQELETILSISFPIRLSLYTLFLPPTALLCLICNKGRIVEIWDKLRLPLIILAFLFGWMWLGAIMSDYPQLALKHSGRYSIMLLTFLAILFALDQDSIKKSGQIFIAIYVFLTALTFLDWHEKLSIPSLLSDYGLHIDLFFRGFFPSSFFENRNPYAVASVAIFFWSLANLKESWLLYGLGMLTSLYSVVIAGSRNGVFTLVLCFLFLLILTLKHIRQPRTILMLGLAFVTLVVIGFSSTNNYILNRTKKTLDRMLNARAYSDLERLDTRFILFRSAFELAIANPPIIGSGTKTFGHVVISQSKDLAHFNNKFFKDAFNSHNFLLTIWIEMGWVGLTAVLLFLWLWFRPAMRGPPMLMMPMFAICAGQIMDYFVWEIFFMAFQSFFFAHFATTITFQEMDQSSS